MKLLVKYHGELATYFPKTSEDNSTSVDIGENDSLMSVMDKFSIPLDKIILILVNGVNVDKNLAADHYFADGDTLAVWPARPKE
jgi:hypothetical protein